MVVNLLLGEDVDINLKGLPVKILCQKMIKIIAVTVLALSLVVIADSIEINLNEGWNIRNANGSECRVNPKLSLFPQ